MYILYMKLENHIEGIKGIGKIRGSHIIQLSALLGLIPLQLYTYLPMHNQGGTGKFLKEKFKWNNKILKIMICS